jgi:hypothetical protein
MSVRRNDLELMMFILITPALPKSLQSSSFTSPMTSLCVLCVSLWSLR